MDESFQQITNRYKDSSSLFKHIDYFLLNSCRYFSTYCYVDYLQRIGVIKPEEREIYIQSLHNLSLSLSIFSQKSLIASTFNLKNHTLYKFDSSFDEIRNNSVIICYIHNKNTDGLNSLHSFILVSNIDTKIDTIYNSWYSTQSIQNNKKYIVNELTGKRIPNDEQEICSLLMPPTKVIVENIYEKLVRLLVRPSLKLLNELFGIEEKHILNNFDLSDFKKAYIHYVKLNV
jgi:hypothetical protein